MIRLTHEEIIKLVIGIDHRTRNPFYDSVAEERRVIAQAQLKKVREWLKEMNISRDIDEELVIEGDTFLALLKECE